MRAVSRLWSDSLETAPVSGLAWSVVLPLCDVELISAVFLMCLPAHAQPVAFPLDNLDLYSFCTPELQAELRVIRDK